jgi:type I restriction enzyme, S subunit
VPSGGIPALRSLNVQPGFLRLDDLVEISEMGHAEHRKSRLVAGDVVIVRSGRPGDAAVIPANGGEMNCIDLIIATPSPRLRSGYLCAVLNSRFGKRQILAGTAGTAQKHFNVGNLARLKMPAPPLHEQAAFEKSLEIMRSSARNLAARGRQAGETHLALLNGLAAV